MVHNAIVDRGLERTLSALHKRNQVWVYMRADIRLYIRPSAVCQKFSETQPAVAVEPYTVSARNRMERLSIDSLVGFPEDNFGNNSIIVIMDYFTRFTALSPQRDNSSMGAARALLQLIGTYGTPAEVLSDNGT